MGLSESKRCQKRPRWACQSTKSLRQVIGMHVKYSALIFFNGKVIKLVQGRFEEKTIICGQEKCSFSKAKQVYTFVIAVGKFNKRVYELLPNSIFSGLSPQWLIYVSKLEIAPRKEIWRPRRISLFGNGQINEETWRKGNGA